MEITNVQIKNSMALGYISHVYDYDEELLVPIECPFSYYAFSLGSTWEEKTHERVEIIGEIRVPICDHVIKLTKEEEQYFESLILEKVKQEIENGN